MREVGNVGTRDPWPILLSLHETAHAPQFWGGLRREMLPLQREKRTALGALPCSQGPSPSRTGGTVHRRPASTTARATKPINSLTSCMHDAESALANVNVTIVSPLAQLHPQGCMERCFFFASILVRKLLHHGDEGGSAVDGP